MTGSFLATQAIAQYVNAIGWSTQKVDGMRIHIGEATATGRIEPVEDLSKQYRTMDALDKLFEKLERIAVGAIALCRYDKTKRYH